MTGFRQPPTFRLGVPAAANALTLHRNAGSPGVGLVARGRDARTRHADATQDARLPPISPSAMPLSIRCARLRWRAGADRIEPPRDAVHAPSGLPRRTALRIGLLAGLAGSLILSAGRSLAAYVSPFRLQISAPAGWLSDIASRSALIDPNSTPHPAAWYTTNYPGLSWGPVNPQLYSVPQNQIGNPSLVTALEYDRGMPVYNTFINAVPAGVSYLDWATQRLMAVAQPMIGTAYQHLHLPTFNPSLVTPPGSFTWNPVSNNPLLQSSQQLLANQPGTQTNPYKDAYGLAAAGIDCTDFTAYLYNLALGYQLHSGTFNQVTFPDMSSGLVGGTAAATVLDATGRVVQPSFFYGPNYGSDSSNAPGSLDSVIDQLQPGDLLYIGNRNGIRHVVMWLGPVGVNQDGTASSVPLVISSHDNTPAIFDTQNINTDPTSALFGFPADGEIVEHLPPPGVHILPFTDQNWFYQDFQLAMRVLPNAAVPAPALPAWAVLAMAHRLRRLRRSGCHRRASASPGPRNPCDSPST